MDSQMVAFMTDTNRLDWTVQVFAHESVNPWEL